MPLRRESKSNPFLLIAILFLVGAIVCIYYVGLPSIKELKAKNQELAVAQADKSAAEQYISDIQTAYGKLSAIQAQLELLNIAAPITPDVPEALIQVNEIVNKNKLTLETLSPGAGSGGVVDIGLTVTGTYAQLKQCLSDLEKNLRPIKVDSVTMASNTNDKGSMTTGGTYAIKMSYVGDKTNAKTGGAANTNTTNPGGTNTVSASQLAGETPQTTGSTPATPSTGVPSASTGTGVTSSPSANTSTGASNSQTGGINGQ